MIVARIAFPRTRFEDVAWEAKFDEPIPLRKGKALATLRDAAHYITKLPKAEHDAEEWQAAMQVYLLVAEHDGPTLSTPQTSTCSTTSRMTQPTQNTSTRS